MKTYYVNGARIDVNANGITFLHYAVIDGISFDPIRFESFSKAVDYLNSVS